MNPTTGRQAQKPRLLIIGGPDVDARIELMQRLRPSFDCAAAGSAESLRPHFEAAGFPYWSYRLAAVFSPMAELRAGWLLWRICRQARPDIVHCFDTRPAIVGRLAARLAGIATIVATLPGLGGLYTHNSARIQRLRRLFSRLHTLSAHHSQHTIFQNSDDRELFTKSGIVCRERSSIITGSGVCAGRFLVCHRNRQQARQALGIAQGEKVVLTVCRLICAKGLLDLSLAAEVLGQTRPDIHFLLAGAWDPAAADALDEGEKDALQARVCWLGQRSDIPELLAAADVFAFPSYYREGIPRALVEAALAGVPIVTTDSVGCREVPSQSGKLVPPRRGDLLAAAILEVLTHPQEASATAEATRQKALQEFELSPIAKDHQALYQRLHGQRSEHRGIDRKRQDRHRAGPQAHAANPDPRGRG